MKKTNIREVARIAGVSPATVSRAINGTGTVTEDTKRKIAEAIRVSGYQPPALAFSDITSPSGIIYCVMKCSSVNVYSQVLTHHLIMAGGKRGLTVVSASIEEPTHFSEESMRFHLRQAQMIGARGIIVSGYTDKTMDANAIQALSESTQPVVCISRSLFSSNYNFNHILTGSDRGGFQATHHLIQHGRRHLLMIAFYTNHGKVRGYEDAIKAFGQPELRSQFRTVPDDSRSSCAEALDAALEQDPKLDGIFCSSDELAAHVLQELTLRGKSVPDQIELIGYNDNLASMLTPPISSIHVPMAEIAEQALDMLTDEKLRSVSSPPKSILLDPMLIIR